MNRSVAFLAAAVTAISTAACAQEHHRSDCRFLRPQMLMKLEGHLAALEVHRRNSDPDALFILDYTDLNEEKTQVGATKIELPSRKMSREYLPYDGTGRSWPPRGYTPFVSGEAPAEQHPLIRSHKLRYEYLGRTGTRRFPVYSEGTWSIGKEERFTGTRRLIYGTRPLLEQDFVNAAYMGDLHDTVQIEPDGDRLVCMCYDGRAGSWIAIFSMKKLEAEQRPAPKGESHR